MTPPASTRRASPTPSSEPKAAPPQDEDVTRSDGEGSGGEKPVREKLRDATLNNPQSKQKRGLEEVDAADESKDGAEMEGTRHRRKRSRDVEENGGVEKERDGTPEVAEENMEEKERDSTPEVAEEIMEERTRDPTPEITEENMEDSGVASPKSKRLREDAQVAEAEGAVEASTPTEERKTKRVRDSGSPEVAEVMTDATSPAKSPSAQIPPRSGLASTSATSPFGAVAGLPTARTAKSPPPQTSDHKFKSSGFGSFASGAPSAFGATVPKTTSAFGASAATGAASPWAAKTATPATQPSAFATASASTGSGFGNTSTASAFGGLGGGAKSGFGGNGTGGFGGALGSSAFSTLGGGSKLASFAAPNTTAPKIEGLSGKPAKAFGASNDTDEDEDPEDTDADEEGTKSPVHESNDHEKDKRFYKQHIETGEEGETTVFTQRAKLYGFDRAAKKWVERGAGVLKLNITEVATTNEENEEEEEGKTKIVDAPEEDEEAPPPRKVHARLLLRADGSQRVVLNSPIVKGARFGDETEPTGMTILFLGRLAGAAAGDAGLDTLQMKVRSVRHGCYPVTFTFANLDMADECGASESIVASCAGIAGSARLK